MILIGVDTGGTFTDVVGYVPERRTLHSLKLSSTPDNPSGAILAGLEGILARLGADVAAVGGLAHGTTVATNATLEGTWAHTALVTTRGFRDVLEIGRQNRPTLYDFDASRPAPVVPRDRRFEVTERLDATGAVVHPLDEADVEAVIARLREARVESVAVVFLFSYLNPDHERRAADALEAALGVPVIPSHEASPEFREYERTSTTVLNAALVPELRRYLSALQDQTRARGISVPWRVMQSNGGVTGVEGAARLPVSLLLSGPAGGVEGARHVGEQVGERDLVTLDMGGTSCDVALILDGRPRLTRQSRIEDRPLNLSAIDIHTVGAGGGSVAWIDAGGALRVGPKSAGALPGPACYGRGGRAPTVTDAQLALGRFSAEQPLGDIARLDLEAARRALHDVVARPLGLELERAALGVLTVADANMERAIRLISVERGHDPRRFALLAFGGAGPLHAGALARRLGIPRVIVPHAAGVLSAFGLLSADVVHHLSQTVLCALDEADFEALNAVLARFERDARARLSRDGVPERAASLAPSADLRYRGQSFELDVPLAGGAFGPDTARELAQRFHAAHARLYGYAAEGEPVELVTLRLKAEGRTPTPAFPRWVAEPQRADGTTARVYFGETGWIDCPWHPEDALGAGTTLDGPALVARAESTVLLAPGERLRVEAAGHFLIDVPTSGFRSGGRAT